MTASTSQVTQSKTPRLLRSWERATWEDYLFYRDQETPPDLKRRLFFDRGSLLIHEMPGEGINHPTIARLIAMLFFIWFSQHLDQVFSDLGGCLLEKPNLQAAVPDLVLYLGDDYPRWREGEPRQIDLTQWRVPDLVGEVGDTTLATDLDEKKKLYAAMGIPEYWVISVQGRQVFAFRLKEDGTYQQCFESVALAGLPISLLEQTLGHLEQGTNGSAALWFSQQIASLASQSEGQDVE